MRTYRPDTEGITPSSATRPRCVPPSRELSSSTRRGSARESSLRKSELRRMLNVTMPILWVATSRPGRTRSAGWWVGRDCRRTRMRSPAVATGHRCTCVRRRRLRARGHTDYAAFTLLRRHFHGKGRPPRPTFTRSPRSTRPHACRGADRSRSFRRRRQKCALIGRRRRE